MLKIIIPLAGASDLFVNSGYHYPKPLIEINGKTMIELVVSNPSKIKKQHQFVFIIKEEDIIKYHLDNTLKLISPDCEIIKIKNSTKGGLCSVLMAIDNVKNDDSLLILNGDQILDLDFDQVDNFWNNENVSAGIVTFNSVHPRWSYARLENELVVQTAEKNPISNQSIAGYYYFEKAVEFFSAAFETIKNDVHFEGMYYISPVINQYVLQNKIVKAYKIDNEKFHSFYSPQLMVEYERSTKSK
jgi:NDP-sugar pyrophosphorylase family protein